MNQPRAASFQKHFTYLVVGLANGEFQIAQRLENPTYYKPRVVIGPGKNTIRWARGG